MDDSEIYERVVEAMNLTGIDAVEFMKNQLIKGDNISSGNLVDNIAYEINQKGNTIQLKITMPFYGKFVEYGRNPGKMPPVKDIEEWCRNKGIPKELAWAIAKSIQKIGTRPHPFCRPYVDTKLISDLKRNLKNTF